MYFEGAMESADAPAMTRSIDMRCQGRVALVTDAGGRVLRDLGVLRFAHAGHARIHARPVVSELDDVEGLVFSLVSRDRERVVAREDECAKCLRHDEC